MSLYSPFFSSGLLAPHTPRCRARNAFDSDFSEPWDDSECSPSCPSSPIPLPDDCAMELDAHSVVKAADSSETRRSVTPTPQSRQTTPVASPQAVKGGSRDVRPRLRRRRSSLTQATSPIRAIRSPTRAAENAFNLRTRSGSLHGDIISRLATEETSLVGRLRSGSCSNVGMLQALNAAPRTAFRSRRFGRRVSLMVVPAAAPPPTAPLPALPLTPLEGSTQHNLRLTNLDFAHGYFNSDVTSMKALTATSARGRGLSVSRCSLDGDENRIDEEMKEN